MKIDVARVQSINRVGGYSKLEHLASLGLWSFGCKVRNPDCKETELFRKLVCVSSLVTFSVEPSSIGSTRKDSARLSTRRRCLLVVTYDAHGIL